MNRNVHRLLNLIICILSLTTRQSAVADSVTYQGAAEKCDQEIQVHNSKLADEYAISLNELMDTFRLRGDLDKTLVVKKEKERFAAEKTLEVKNVAEVPVELKELQQKYMVAPLTSTKNIAKSYLNQLEEVKRKLTIDGKLEEAIAAKAEMDKIQKKYAVTSPKAGGEFRSEDMPGFVTMTKTATIPVIVDGQQVGLNSLHQGDTYRLVKVDGPQVVIRVDKSNIVVPVEVTDLLNRIAQQQRGVSEETSEDNQTVAGNANVVKTEAANNNAAIARAMVGKWRIRFGNGNVYIKEFLADGSVIQDGHTTDQKWYIYRDRVTIYISTDDKSNPNAGEHYLFPIRPEGVSVNNRRGSNDPRWNAVAVKIQ